MESDGYCQDPNSGVKLCRNYHGDNYRVSQNCHNSSGPAEKAELFCRQAAPQARLDFEGDYCHNIRMIFIMQTAFGYSLILCKRKF